MSLRAAFDLVETGALNTRWSNVVDAVCKLADHADGRRVTELWRRLGAEVPKSLRDLPVRLRVVEHLLAEGNLAEAGTMLADAAPLTPAASRTLQERRRRMDDAALWLNLQSPYDPLPSVDRVVTLTREHAELLEPWIEALVRRLPPSEPGRGPFLALVRELRLHDDFVGRDSPAFRKLLVQLLSDHVQVRLVRARRRPRRRRGMAAIVGRCGPLDGRSRFTSLMDASLREGVPSSQPRRRRRSRTAGERHGRTRPVRRFRPVAIVGVGRISIRPIANALIRRLRISGRDRGIESSMVSRRVAEFISTSHCGTKLDRCRGSRLFATRVRRKVSRCVAQRLRRRCVGNSGGKLVRVGATTRRGVDRCFVPSSRRSSVFCFQSSTGSLRRSFPAGR